MTDLNSAEEGMAHGRAVLADTNASLDRTLGVVSDAKQVPPILAATSNSELTRLCETIGGLRSWVRRRLKSSTIKTSASPVFLPRRVRSDPE